MTASQECGACGYELPEGEHPRHEFHDGPLCEECYRVSCEAEDRGKRH